jgi:uncharacterized protein YjbI with pentapeptide repeats
MITSLIFQSFDNAREIRALDDPYRRFELLSQERSSRATTYSTAIVLAGAIFGYYQFIYSQREKDSQKFESAEAILYSLQSSPPARIRAMAKLNDWAADKGVDGQNQVARVIADGLRVWAQKTNLENPCKNSRVFYSRRVSSDTVYAINILKNILKITQNRTIFLDFSELVLQDIDFSGANEDHRVNLRFADFHGADLSGAKLNYVNLQGADFYCANLYAAELKGSVAKKPEPGLAAPQEVEPKRAKPDFNTNFVQTRMQWAKLQGTDFTGANLVDADLKQATVDAQTQFSNADMRHAILESLTVKGKPNLAKANLENACVDEGTWATIKPNGAENVRMYPLTAPPPECQAPKYGKE